MTKKEMAAKLAQPISELGISIRTVNALEEKGIHTKGELLDCCTRSAAECNSKCLCRPKMPIGWRPLQHLPDIPQIGPVLTREIISCFKADGFN